LAYQNPKVLMKAPIQMITIPSLRNTALQVAVASLGFGVYTVAAQAQDVKPAQQCMTDLTAFDNQLQKDGYWLHGSGYGYGYPMYGYGYGYGAGLRAVPTTSTSTRYQRARPGYEIRTLLASAKIVAQNGDRQACESLLGIARSKYTTYAEDLRSGKVPPVDMSAWRQQQIASAVAVTGASLVFRADQLIGAGVVNPKGEDLGSVDDIVMDPQTGKIGYLVLARGGIFGFGENYVPVPWKDFKATPGNKLFVLASTKSDLDSAPKVKENQNFEQDGFAKEIQKVNAYWASHLTR
jgi:sporulation protein YlmC with PRC-barrel domain